MKTFRRWAALTVGAFSAALLIPGAGFADESSPAAQQTQGVWQKHEYEFAYFGFTTTYSCDGLADKIRVLLIAAGARNDAKSRPGACASGLGRPDKFARAYLTFYTLGPDGGGNGSNSQATPGTWRAVAFSDRSPRELRVGDCELIEQFRNNVLPMFVTRAVENHTTCVPHQDSGSNIDLKFESFSAPPKVGAPR